MLYGVHVFSRAKIVPDLAVLRGDDAYRQAKVIGDRSLEFLAAGGTALAHLDLGEVDEAKTWVDRAAAVASESPTSFRARTLETWKGVLATATGDAAGARSHLERAVQMATDHGLGAARCESLAQLAVSLSRLGAESADNELLEIAKRAADQVNETIDGLPGHPPWGAQADAALARIALARGERDEAASAARRALVRMMESLQEDAHVEIFLPVAAALIEVGTDEEAAMARSFLQFTLAMAAQRTMDEAIRVKWLKGPVGRELSELAGSLDGLTMSPGGEGTGFEAADAELFGPLVQGLSNSEIAEALGVDETEVSKRLARLYAKIGASSRAEATAFAFREQVV
jgi:ATP/maltotriose-dependent transcriptional regulator MalT